MIFLYITIVVRIPLTNNIVMTYVPYILCTHLGNNYDFKNNTTL